MKRPLTAKLAAAAALPVALAAAIGASTSTAATAPPVASLTHFVCHHALDPSGRSVSVTSVMRPVPGAQRAAVRFRLLQRDRGSSAWARLSGPGLGTWISQSFASGGVWRVIHPVSDLAAPAAYRFAVAFRWTGAGGRVLARASRTSRACRQPELRPDLEVLSIAVQADPISAQQDDYAVQVRDAGATGAGPFTVQLDDQGVLVNRRVWHIDPHTTRLVKLVGPLCQASDPPRVTADPGHHIDVWTRARSSLAATCPTAPASGSGASGS